MTMASSTTNPVAIVNAISVKLLILKPNKYIAPKVPTNDKGTATLGINVAEKLLKKKKITITTKQTDKSISNLASCTEALIVVVLSFRIETSILLGKVCLILGKI